MTMRLVLKCKDCGYEGNEDHECVSPDGFYQVLRPVVVYELLALENGVACQETTVEYTKSQLVSRFRKVLSKRE